MPTSFVMMCFLVTATRVVGKRRQQGWWAKGNGDGGKIDRDGNRESDVVEEGTDGGDKEGNVVEEGEVEGGKTDGDNDKGGRRRRG